MAARRNYRGLTWLWRARRAGGAPVINDCDAKNLRSFSLKDRHFNNGLKICLFSFSSQSSLLDTFQFWLCTYLLSFQGHNLLQKLYEDPKRWAFLFQTYIQLTMLQEHNKPCSAPVKIMERSLLRRDSFLKLFQGGSKIIFGQNCTICTSNSTF